MFIAIIITLLTALVYNLFPEHIQEKIRNWIADTLKLAARCAVPVVIILLMFIFLPNALGEELPQDYYYKVVFLQGSIEEYSVEEVDGKVEVTYYVHGDDLNHIWDYYEIEEEGEIWETDDAISAIAKLFIDKNNLWCEEDTTNRITLGRIVVLTIWEANPDDPFDDEVVNSYFSEYLTDTEV